MMSMSREEPNEDERGEDVSDSQARMVLLQVLRHSTEKQNPYIETKCPS
jgi:hypothetical protein